MSTHHGNRSTTGGKYTLVAFALLLAASSTLAQESTGSLYGQVSDTSGEALAGVALDLTGPGASRVAQTDNRGEFRFLGLDPAGYRLVVIFPGHGTLEYPDIDIRVGRSTRLELVLDPSAEGTETITTASPLLDELRISQGTMVARIEMDRIPTGRDPWSALPQTPGVRRDRVDVGGSELGAQGIWFGPGVSCRR